MNPFISICTPTFNRRPFIPFIIECFNQQTYPRHLMEWIIIDDGTDKIEDLILNIPEIKYFKYDIKMTLGKKRNIMHEKCKGDIIVYMDDDDYYHPERVSHAVEMLQNSDALCAGSSEMHIYFKHLSQLYQFGPYKETHATAATFAFKRELLKITSYDDDACIAEETHFLKNYTIPFVQLDICKTMLVFSHIHNSFDKKELLDNPSKYIKKSPKNIDNFISDPILKKFYLEDVDTILESYDPGHPKYKPDVILQYKNISERRQNIMQDNFIKMQQQSEKTIEDKSCLINMLLKKVKELKTKLARYEDVK